MRHTRCLALGLVLAATISLVPAAFDDPVYPALGRLAVQQQGRVKPFDTMAREAVKQIHGGPSLRERGPNGDTLANWPAVAAVLDWSIRPQYWDDQEIILVQSLPLKQTLLNEAVRDLLKSIVSRPIMDNTARDTLTAMAGSPLITADDLTRSARLPDLTAGERASLVRMARKFSGDQKWLSPNDIEDATVTVEGKLESFPDWFATIVTKDQAVRAGQSGGRIQDTAPIAPLQGIEARALEAGERLLRYKALRNQDARALEGLEIKATPRPANAAYLAFTRAALLTAPRFVSETFPVENLDELARDSLRANASPQGPDPFQANAIEVFAGYIDDVKKKERFRPGTNPASDARYLSWLEQKSAWLPIRFLLELDLKELERAGYSVALVEEFRTAYHALAASERAHPGHAARERAANLVSAARRLGISASKAYPTEAALALETHYNRAAPFSWAPWSYGIALVLFLTSLGVADVRGHDPLGTLGRGLYDAGMVALATGIIIESYGFTLRVMISGWAPVTNMYETVIWVALVTSVLGLVFEFIHRKTFAALAASGIALLATVLAATVSEQLLDPRIKSLSPVLRSNYWLTIHVLTIVSSYAAFALAMGLGTVAIGYYLTATYRRPAPYRALVIPLVPGVMFLVAGALMGALAHSLAGPAWLSGNAANYVAWGVAGLGGVLTILSACAMIGETANREPTRTLKAGLAGLGIALIGLIAAWAGPGSVVLFDGAVLGASVGATVAVLGLFGMASRLPVADQPSARGGHAPQDSAPASIPGSFAASTHPGSGVATLTKPRIAAIQGRAFANRPGNDERSLAMQATAGRIKPIARFVDRAMQVGVLLVAAGTILGGVWADRSWGRFWGWDPKEVWALITLLVYLVPLHGRFAGWVNTFGLVVSSVVCFGSVVMAWYGVNFVLGVGLHSYGFSEGGGQGVVLSAVLVVLAVVLGAAWRRRIAQTAPASDPIAAVQRESIGV